MAGAISSRNGGTIWRLIDGVCVTPRAGTNQRDLDLDKQMDPSKQKIAYYHANMMPPPDQQGPHPVDRKAALAAAALLESPAAGVATPQGGRQDARALHPDPAASAARQAGGAQGDHCQLVVAYLVGGQELAAAAFRGGSP